MLEVARKSVKQFLGRIVLYSGRTGKTKSSVTGSWLVSTWNSEKVGVAGNKKGTVTEFWKERWYDLIFMFNISHWLPHWWWSERGKVRCRKVIAVIQPRDDDGLDQSELLFPVKVWSVDNMLNKEMNKFLTNKQFYKCIEMHILDTLLIIFIFRALQL